MNMSNTDNNDMNSATMDVRPKLRLFHPTASGTGCAVKMELHPAHDDTDGSMMMIFANQKTVGGKDGGMSKFATFDWENRITVKLDFSDICRILQVFRGECESIEDGRGLYHKSPRYATKIVLRHVLEPRNGYSMEVYRNFIDNSAPDAHSHIMFTPAEAYGIAAALEDSIGVICFGIPKVIPHDVSGYRSQVRAMRHVSAAVA